ncbi:hypothetical protein ACJX0J_017520, partial [Zea mays]
MRGLGSRVNVSVFQTGFHFLNLVLGGQAMFMFIIRVRSTCFALRTTCLSLSAIPNAWLYTLVYLHIFILTCCLKNGYGNISPILLVDLFRNPYLTRFFESNVDKKLRHGANRSFHLIYTNRQTH